MKRIFNGSNTLFSVLVPAYKGKYLKECIDSIFNQTYSNFELIIVNDASPEDLASIVKKYQDERIRYYVNESNIGAENVVYNWNKCLSYAKGEYVICMGDDDCLMPNCLAEYNWLIREHPGIGLLHGWTEIIDENSRPFKITQHRCAYESAVSLLWHRLSAYHDQYIGDFCFRRDLLIKNGGFFYLPLAWGSDEISSIIAASENGVLNTQEIVFQYRMNPLTISSTGSTTKKIEALQQKIDWMRKFLSSPIDNSVEELYRKNSMSMLPRHFERLVSNLIIKDLKDHTIFHSFYWLVNRKKYEVKRKTIIYAILYRLFS